MKPILGSRICNFSPECKEDKPCGRCLYIGRTEPTVFTPYQEKEIQEFLDRNSDLMDDLSKLEDIEKAALENLKNFGTPECFYCGHCGTKLSLAEALPHMEANQKGECADAQSQDSQT